jgi:F420-non-reducing hydrogenase large subunit
MTRTITIKPVTRIEGHASIDIYLDGKGEVKDTRLQILDLRGFEAFCLGRPVEEMPQIMPRICGICSVSHHLASAKACDAVFGARIPGPAAKLRELMHMGQFIHNHAFHFFMLAAPDFIFGPDADPATRNIAGVIKRDPKLAKMAIRERSIGQGIIEAVGGRPIHPVSAIPGGVSSPLSEEKRDGLLKDANEALELTKFALKVGKPMFEKFTDMIKTFDGMKSHFMSIVGGNGNFELYDGPIRIMDPKGKVMKKFDPAKYLDIVAEHVEPWTYLKFPYLRKIGWPEGAYRVGPLARINVADKISTPLAQAELEEFRAGFGRPAHLALLNHHARLIELLYACERAVELLKDSDITSKDVRAEVSAPKGEGVGAVEAPRGTLFHHYKTDGDGFLTDVNLVVATAQNYPAMHLGIRALAKALIKGGEVSEGLLNRAEMLMRAYDPCLSCATHTVRAGQFPIEIKLFNEAGSKVRTISNIVR